MWSSGDGVLIELGHWEWALWVSLVLVPASVPHSLSLPSDYHLVHWDKHKRPHAPTTTSQAALLTRPSPPWYAVLSNHESESILHLLGSPFVRYLTWWGEKKANTANLSRDTGWGPWYCCEDALQVVLRLSEWVGGMWKSRAGTL